MQLFGLGCGHFFLSRCNFQVTHANSSSTALAIHAAFSVLCWRALNKRRKANFRLFFWGARPLNAFNIRLAAGGSGIGIVNFKVAPINQSTVPKNPDIRACVKKSKWFS